MYCNFVQKNLVIKIFVVKIFLYDYVNDCSIRVVRSFIKIFV